MTNVIAMFGTAMSAQVTIQRLISASTLTTLSKIEKSK